MFANKDHIPLSLWNQRKIVTNNSEVIQWKKFNPNEKVIW